MLSLVLKLYAANATSGDDNIPSEYAPSSTSYSEVEHSSSNEEPTESGEKTTQTKTYSTSTDKCRCSHSDLSFERCIHHTAAATSGVAQSGTSRSIDYYRKHSRADLKAENRPLRQELHEAAALQLASFVAVTSGSPIEPIDVVNQVVCEAVPESAPAITRTLTFASMPLPMDTMAAGTLGVGSEALRCQGGASQGYRLRWISMVEFHTSGLSLISVCSTISGSICPAVATILCCGHISEASISGFIDSPLSSSFYTRWSSGPDVPGKTLSGSGVDTVANLPPCIYDESGMSSTTYCQSLRRMDINGVIIDVFTGPDLIIHQSEQLLAGMGEWCQTHHAANGLIEAVRNSRVTEREAEEEVMDFVCSKIGSETKQPLLAGNSVYVDLMFLRRYMPRLAALFPHVVVDVSSIKALCMRWFPKDAERAPAKKKTHRAMDDIKESIAELKYMQKAIFKESKR
ncbi:hypothetical protein GOP47_0003722 [Adiantum capillus-veneris]|uniref:Exonuclease domain-containing protein n=1 Tax=Adiantum capillus-veneris TaxID=13818 RepID=A0A9D4V6N4_ADICA|nr:hypothetical protein GOP47_0003722 [Adiantum capillus-veneris]